MRYYIWMEEDQSSQAYGKPYALFRIEIGNEKIITDWWNPEADSWEHHPGLIVIKTIYGAGNYHEVNGTNIESIKRTISNGWGLELT